MCSPAPLAAPRHACFNGSSLARFISGRKQSRTSFVSEESAIIELIAVVAFSMLCAFLNAWLALAERDYLRLRSTRARMPNPPFERDEAARRYVPRPWRWLIEGAGLIRGAIRTYSSPQADSELETARLHYLHRRRIALTLGALAFVFLLIVLSQQR